jgi:hypothetical protein
MACGGRAQAATAAPLPAGIVGHNHVTGEADQLECIPARIHIGAMELQCRSLKGLPNGTIVGIATFASHALQAGAIGCGFIAPDQAPPQQYPYGCNWLPGETDASIDKLPRP